MDQPQGPEGQLVKKKLAKFTIDFLRVENLQNGAKVYLSWGMSKNSRTRVMPVVGGVADFRGETFQREIMLRRNRKFVDYFRSEGITIRLRQKRHKHVSSTIAYTRLDFSRHTGDWQTHLERPFDISSWTKPLRTGLMAPVIVMNVSCSWNDPAVRLSEQELLRRQRPLLRREGALEEEQPQAQPASVPTTTPTTTPTTAAPQQPTETTAQAQPQLQEQREAPQLPKSPKPQQAPPTPAKSPPQEAGFFEKMRQQQQQPIPGTAAQAEV